MNGCNSECFLLVPQKKTFWIASRWLQKDGSCSNTFLMEINTVHIMQTQTKVKQKKSSKHSVHQCNNLFQNDFMNNLCRNLHLCVIILCENEWFAQTFPLNATIYVRMVPWKIYTYILNKFYVQLRQKFALNVTIYTRTFLWISSEICSKCSTLCKNGFLKDLHTF